MHSDGYPLKNPGVTFVQKPPKDILLYLNKMITIHEEVNSNFQEIKEASFQTF